MPSDKDIVVEQGAHPFQAISENDAACRGCGESVDSVIHQPPLPKWIKCRDGHVLELTDAYRFITCPWCQAGLTVQW